MKCIYILIFFFFIEPALLFATELCSLQPEGFDDSKESIIAFEKNIEDTVSDIYRKQYPLIVQKIKEVQQLQKELDRFERKHIQKYITFFSRHPRSQAVNHQRLREREKAFLELVEKDIQSELEFRDSLKDVNTLVRSISFLDYRKYIDTVNELKGQISNLNDALLKMRSFDFLQPPDIQFSFKDNRSYKTLKAEGLFNAPVDEVLQFPFFKFGFSANSNTIIYSCIYLDEMYPDMNRVYFYFLSTEKFYNFDWQDLFEKPKVVILNFLTSYQEPRVIISPLPIVIDPLFFIPDKIKQFNPIQKIYNHSSFGQLMKLVDRFGFLNISTQINTNLVTTVSNMKIGVKGFSIQPNQLQIRYAGVTLYGLIRFQLPSYKKQKDFLLVMEKMNLEDWHKSNEN